MGGIHTHCQETPGDVLVQLSASGTSLLVNGEQGLREVSQIAKLLAEIAHLNSDCLYAALEKHAKGTYRVLETDDTWRAIKYNTEGQELIDQEDWYRIGYVARKIHTPFPLTIFATEGLVEDFFGAWTSQEGSGYNPDDHWQELLDFN